MVTNCTVSVFVIAPVPATRVFSKPPPCLTQGPKVAQVALGYGANDFGSVMIEENVVSASGEKHIVSADEFERLIRDAGYEPYRRNTRYEPITA